MDQNLPNVNVSPVGAGGVPVAPRVAPEAALPRGTAIEPLVPLQEAVTFPQPSGHMATVTPASVNPAASGKSRTLEERVVAVMSAMMGGSVDDLNLICELLAELIDGRRVRVWRVSEDKARFDLVTEWVAEGERSLVEDWKTMETEGLPWTLGQLRQSQIVVMEAVAELPSGAEKDLETLTRQQIESAVFVPFGVGYEIGGAIEVDGVKAPDEWTNLQRMEYLSLIAKGVGHLFQAPPEQTADNIETKEYFKAIFESVNVGIMVLGDGGVVKEANGYAARMFGMSLGGLVGRKIEELASQFSAGSIEALHRNLGMLRMGTPLPPFEVEVASPEGNLKVLEFSALILYDQGKPVGDMILLSDATIKREIERAVEDSERRLRTVLESVKEGITFSDEKGHFNIFNSEMESLTGYTKAEANAAENFYRLIHPEESTELAEAGKDLAQMKVGEKRTSEVRLHSKSGIVKQVVVSTSVLDHDDRKMYLSAFHDVSEIKKTEAELRSRNVELEQITAQLNETAVELQKARDNLEAKVLEKTEELRRTLSQMEDLARFSSEDPFPILRVSSGGQVLYANAASSGLLKKWKTEVNQGLPEEWRQMVVEVFERNNRKIAEVELEEGIISFVLVPVRAGGYVNLYGRDVTHEKEIERMKNEFISLVSHQVRTPLTSMRWYSEILIKAKDHLSADQVEVVQIIHETSVKLAEMVNDLLNLSRMESGKLELLPVAGELEKVLTEVLEELKLHAEKKQVAVQCQTEPLPPMVFDVKMVREIFMNLLSNAIKYSSDGGTVELAMRFQGEEVLVEVSDHGIGIPVEAQKDIFQRFYRAQNAVDADIEGTGLGLSVAKMMVEKCGGKIWFESDPGRKTSFYFTLPLKVQGSSHEIAAEEAAGLGAPNPGSPSQDMAEVKSFAAGSDASPTEKEVSMDSRAKLPDDSPKTETGIGNSSSVARAENGITDSHQGQDELVAVPAGLAATLPTLLTPVSEAGGEGGVRVLPPPATAVNAGSNEERS